MSDVLSERQLSGLVALLSYTTTHHEITPVALSLVDEVRASRRELEKLKAQLLEAQHDARRFKLNHLDACTTIAQMHDAAMGESGAGARRGVVEDVQDLFQANVTLKRTVEELNDDLRAIGDAVRALYRSEDKLDYSTEQAWISDLLTLVED